ncbi:glycoside hydrolase family 61 protein [Piloderma croceum F 1598]|uniref:lytic cellulose monooxygenase (C4-dehydrogenating) n=1 Tax=Piloderma croceum (strain F 1598) TaxID=765440 RepID=A0A0C3C9X4_PILCF|nr:glycoside hydrolase family 61 protein [Piloderma croceum F 1598]
MKTITTLFFLQALVFTPYVSAHGYVSVLAVDGTPYKGQEPTEDGQPNVPSVVRRISTIDPVKGASNPFLNCGQNATAASLVAPTNPGSALTFQWEAGGGEGWPHNIGPLMFYLANCGDTTCDQFDATTAKWFKISQVGLESDEVTWYQQNLMDGHVANVTLPSNIAPGNYIIRHEIIALHLANEMGGAEFYPSCSQLNISGSGTGAPTSDELVSFPGAYKDDDPGIYVPAIFNGPISNYTYPGPAVASFAASGTSSSGSSPAGGTSPSTSTSSSKPTGVSSSNSSKSGKCQLQKQNTVALYPRHFSRAMRRLLFGSSF